MDTKTKRRISKQLKHYLELMQPNDSIEEYLSAEQNQLVSHIESVQGKTGAKDAKDAVEGIERLYQGKTLTKNQIHIVEALVLPRERPVVDIMHNNYLEVASPWERLTQDRYRDVIVPAIPSAGRIELPHDYNRPFAGSGFVVGKDLILTNRHVAELLASGVGTHINFFEYTDAAIDFKREVTYSKPQPFAVKEVPLIHPHWDIAFLRVPGIGNAHQPLLLDANPPSQLDGTEIVVIGYPARDTREGSNPQLQDEIFRGYYNVKRMLPGKLREIRPIRNYWGNEVEALTHDSSTLGGSSGSLVMELTKGHIVGVHFAGIYLDANFAVPTWELARDPRIQDLGVNFHGTPAVGTPPVWLDEWDKLLPPQDTPSTPERECAPTPKRFASIADAFTIPGYEWTEDWQIREALATKQRADVVRQLRNALGAEEAEDLIRDLQEGLHTEGFWSTEPDPDLPEIIYLHGIMGSHLANMRAGGSKIWLSALSFARGNVVSKLTLRSDGVTDKRDDIEVQPMGHLWIKYGKAARKWRKMGYVVHEFSFDWRKPVTVSAARLNDFITKLKSSNPHRRLVLVAHSMGGLVSSLYAKQYPGWNEAIEQAIVVGSPLAGSFAPLEAVIGSYPFFQTLAALSRGEDVMDLQRAAATMPGLMTMLPDPQIFKDQIPEECNLFVRASWRPTQEAINTGIDPTMHPLPAQRWLDHARQIKQEILESPLLEVCTGIVCDGFATMDSAIVEHGILREGSRTGAGDGTVPIMAAAIPQLHSIYKAEGYRHDDMMRNPKVIQAVDELLRNGQIDALDTYSVADAQNASRFADVETPTVPEGAEAGIRRRFQSGQLTQADLDWLLDPIRGDAPE